MKLNKKLLLGLLVTGALATGCRKYLDINSDPSSPQTPDLASLMQPVVSFMPKMMSVDIITVGQLIQNWGHVTANENFEVHGGNTPAQSIALWRSFYAQQGVNVNLIIQDGINQRRWDYVGAAIAIRAWGLQQTTDFFGEMPFHDAWEEGRVTFKYDSQEEIYKDIDSLCVVALDYLQRTDGNNTVSMARGDRVYNGDRTKWIKFVYGLRARSWQRLSNKPIYNPDSVIAFIDKSFASAADNFLVSHTATANNDSNPLSGARDNVSVRKQGRFMVQLLDGATLRGSTTGPNRDPRIRGMLAVSPDTSTVTTATMPSANGGYRFIIPAGGDPNNTALPVNNIQGIPTNPLYRQRVSTPYADSAIVDPVVNNFSSSLGKYVFRANALYPVMTYHELQFIKAEALLRKGQPVSAHAAYKTGITEHFAFVNFMNQNANPGISAISPTERDAYLASPAVQQVPSAITLTDIMLQKYIGDYAWNLLETWSDIRRYHYFDLDPATGQQVYKNFVIPAYSTANQGAKPQYRYRPTGVSENDWNLDELRRIGALNVDYHTYEMWFSKP